MGCWGLAEGHGGGGMAECLGRGGTTEGPGRGRVVDGQRLIERASACAVPQIVKHEGDGEGEVTAC